MAYPCEECQGLDLYCLHQDNRFETYGISFYNTFLSFYRQNRGLLTLCQRELLRKGPEHVEYILDNNLHYTSISSIQQYLSSVLTSQSHRRDYYQPQHPQFQQQQQQHTNPTTLLPFHHCTASRLTSTSTPTPSNLLRKLSEFLSRCCFPTLPPSAFSSSFSRSIHALDSISPDTISSLISLRIYLLFCLDLAPRTDSHHTFSRSPSFPPPHFQQIEQIYIEELFSFLIFNILDTTHQNHIHNHINTLLAVFSSQLRSPSQPSMSPTNSTQFGFFGDIDVAIQQANNHNTRSCSSSHPDFFCQSLLTSITRSFTAFLAALNSHRPNLNLLAELQLHLVQALSLQLFQLLSFLDGISCRFTLIYVQHLVQSVSTPQQQHNDSVPSSFPPYPSEFHSSSPNSSALPQPSDFPTQFQRAVKKEYHSSLLKNQHEFHTDRYNWLCKRERSLYTHRLYFNNFIKTHRIIPFHRPSETINFDSATTEFILTPSQQHHLQEFSSSLYQTYSELLFDSKCWNCPVYLSLNLTNQQLQQVILPQSAPLLNKLPTLAPRPTANNTLEFKTTPTIPNNQRNVLGSLDIIDDAPLNPMDDVKSQSQSNLGPISIQNLLQHHILPMYVETLSPPPVHPINPTLSPLNAVEFPPNPPFFLLICSNFQSSFVPTFQTETNFAASLSTFFSPPSQHQRQTGLSTISTESLDTHAVELNLAFEFLTHLSTCSICSLFRAHYRSLSPYPIKPVDSNPLLFESDPNFKPHRDEKLFKHLKAQIQLFLSSLHTAYPASQQFPPSTSPQQPQQSSASTTATGAQQLHPQTATASPMTVQLTMQQHQPSSVASQPATASIIPPIPPHLRRHVFFKHEPVRVHGSYMQESRFQHQGSIHNSGLRQITQSPLPLSKPPNRPFKPYHTFLLEFKSKWSKLLQLIGNNPEATTKPALFTFLSSVSSNWSQFNSIEASFDSTDPAQKRIELIARWSIFSPPITSPSLTPFLPKPIFTSPLSHPLLLSMSYPASVSLLKWIKSTQNPLLALQPFTSPSPSSFNLPFFSTTPTVFQFRFYFAPAASPKLQHHFYCKLFLPNLSQALTTLPAPHSQAYAQIDETARSSSPNSPQNPLHSNPPHKSPPSPTSPHFLSNSSQSREINSVLQLHAFDYASLDFSHEFLYNLKQSVVFYSGIPLIHANTLASLNIHQFMSSFEKMMSFCYHHYIIPIPISALNMTAAAQRIVDQPHTHREREILTLIYMTTNAILKQPTFPNPSQILPPHSSLLQHFLYQFHLKAQQPQQSEVSPFHLFSFLHTPHHVPFHLLLSTFHTSSTSIANTIAQLTNQLNENIFLLTSQLLIDFYAFVNFPPCMLYMYTRLKNIRHLKHGARFQLRLFLKDIGLPLSEALSFWLSTLPSMNVNELTYGVRHTYGKEGARKQYSMPSCSSLSRLLTTDIHHGCYFAHFSKLSRTNTTNSNDAGQQRFAAQAKPDLAIEDLLSFYNNNLSRYQAGVPLPTIPYLRPQQPNVTNQSIRDGVVKFQVTPLTPFELEEVISTTQRGDPVGACRMLLLHSHPTLKTKIVAQTKVSEFAHSQRNYRSRVTTKAKPRLMSQTQSNSGIDDDGWSTAKPQSRSSFDLDSNMRQCQNATQTTQQSHRNQQSGQVGSTELENFTLNQVDTPVAWYFASRYFSSPRRNNPPSPPFSPPQEQQ